MMATSNGNTDEIEDEVLNWVATQDVNVVEEVFRVIPLDISPSIKGKKRKLLKTLFSYLDSLEEIDGGDGGYSVFLAIKQFMDSKTIDLEESSISDVNVDCVKKENNESQSDNFDNSKYLSETKLGKTVDLMRWKEFKISGTIAGKGDNKISYTSLSYQIEEGKRQGFSEQQICGAIVKAIAPGNHLRTYLESRKFKSLQPVIEILRSHFKEKDSSAVFTELSNATQQVNETCFEYVTRLLCLREKVFILSREENCPYDNERLKKTFFHTMFTGMRNVHIRNELRELCRDKKNLGDELLMKFVAEAIQNDSERNEKLTSSRKMAGLNLVETEQIDKNVIKDVKKNPFSEIENLRTSHQNEMSALKAELLEIKTVLKDALQVGKTDPPSVPQNPYREQNFGNRRNVRGPIKCRNCYEHNIYRCIHCLKCGSPEHRIAACPKNV